MKICILCNFGPYLSVGGSEAVIMAVAEEMVKKYNYEVDIYAHNYKKAFRCNGINLFPCPKGDKIINKISNKYSHIFVYSDSFWNMEDILHIIKKIVPRLSLCLVGAYFLQSHPDMFNLLKENIDRFNLITHSTFTPDYKWCIDNNLPVKVIPNGVNLEEFRNNSINFREKFNIKEKYIILNVGNYFFGKGFELLPQIARKIKSKDIIILSISNSVKYPYDKIFFERTKKQSKGLNIRFLRDLPREDVVAAFNVSDLFLFTSKKEVAPLVILESQAAKLPWISMDVGNVKERRGGIVINNNKEDHKGYKIVDDKIINSYLVNIADILELKDVREKLINDGQKNIDKIGWKNIVPLYHEVFSR